jgi:hypothetical protein
MTPAECHGDALLAACTVKLCGAKVGELCSDAVFMGGRRERRQPHKGRQRAGARIRAAILAPPTKATAPR